MLVNPLHAAEPVRAARAVALPADLAPLRQPDLPARRADPRVRHRAGRGPRPAVAGWAGGWPSELAGRDVIDRDATWTAKRAALQALFAVPRTPGRQAAFDAYRAREGVGLTNFATWSALATAYGPD